VHLFGALGCLGAGGGGLSLDAEDAMVLFLVRLYGAMVSVPGCCVRGNVESARFLLLGDASEIRQRLNFVTKRFLAMDGTGHEQFPTPKSGV
jgi:hypothetical protein